MITRDDLGGMLAGAIVGFLFALFLVSLAIVLHGQFGSKAHGQEYPNCSGWISHSCCCTNECCFEVEPGTVQNLDVNLNRFRIVATGQEIERTGWSKDGRFMRCACDHDATTGKWVKHPKAHTRCIYPPQPNS